jgi:hypothetical protein
MISQSGIDPWEDLQYSGRKIVMIRLTSSLFPRYFAEPMISDEELSA